MYSGAPGTKTFKAELQIAKKRLDTRICLLLFTDIAFGTIGPFFCLKMVNILYVFYAFFSHSLQVELELLRFLCERIVKREKVKVYSY